MNLGHGFFAEYRLSTSAEYKTFSFPCSFRNCYENGGFAQRRITPPPLIKRATIFYGRTSSTNDGDHISSSHRPANKASCIGVGHLGIPHCRFKMSLLNPVRFWFRWSAWWRCQWGCSKVIQRRQQVLWAGLPDFPWCLGETCMYWLSHCLFRR